MASECSSSLGEGAHALNAEAAMSIRRSTKDEKDKRLAECMTSANGELMDKAWVWNALDDEDLRRKFFDMLPPPRQKVGRVLTARWAESSLCSVLIFNVLVAILETDATADGEDSPKWITVMNAVLLAIYTFEIFLRLVLYHLYYFRSFWNWIDITVVSLDLALNISRGIVGALPNISALRTIRLLRLARAHRVIRIFPELHVMVMGLVGTVRTVFWGLVLLFAFLIIFALVAVQCIYPIAKTVDWDGCQRCERAYSSVWEASLTIIQQVIAGDSWGTGTLQLIEKEPAAILYFMWVLFTINFLVINLILAVVVERAQQAHDNDHAVVVQQQAKERAAQHEKAQQELVRMCVDMDTDKSGCLTLEELLTGFDNEQYFANSLKAMDIDKEDLQMVFNILDKDGSGDIDYFEFVDQLHRLKTQDQRTLLLFILHHIKELEKSTRKAMRRRREVTEESSFQNSSMIELTAISEAPRSDDIAGLHQLVQQAQTLAAAQAELANEINSTYARIVANRTAGEDTCLAFHTV